MNKKMLYFSVSIIAVFLLSAAIAGNNLGVSAKSDKKSNVNSTRTDAWIEDLQANFDNPQWFYDHLNTTDRLNIRLALDYAIPRTDIINSILNTFGVPLATTDVPQTGAYFNPTPQAREYNLTIAASLLTKVFGYEYGSDDSATPYDESLPYFFMGLVVPSTNPLRSQWAERIQFNYKQIGVDVSTILLTFDQITSRLFANIAGIGYDYDHGGSDGLFVGWAGSPLPDDGFFFYSSQSMPYGNYQFVNSTTLDNYINIEDTNKDEATRIQAYHDVQTFLHEQVVKNVLFQNLNTYVMNKDLHNFNPFYAGQGALPYQNLSFTGASAGKTDFVVAIPGELSDMNPLISNAVYDNYFIGQLWQGGLLTLADQPNDPTFSNYSIYTNMADWYNVSTDQLDYFFNLKSGLKWQDDTPINASDVAFTYLAAMNPDLNSPAGPTLNRQLSNTTSIIVHNSTLIEFKLTQWDPLTLTNLFTLTILPQHVYSAGNLADVTKWSTDATDTGSGGAGSIIGSGPYEFVSYSNGVGKLKAWSGYDAAYASKFSEVPYNSAPTLTNITIVKINDADVALTALKNGEADYGDTNIGFNSIFSQVLAASNLVNVNATGAVWQELGLNQASPIWGLSPQDPSVLYYVAPTASSSVESSSTAGTPFGDITTIVGAMTFVAIVAVFYRKRKNRLE